MTIRGAVFDFDGTLVDSNAIKRRTWFEVARDLDPHGELVAGVLHGAPRADRHALGAAIGRAAAQRDALPRGVPSEQWAKRLVHEYTARCEEAIARCAEVPGATAALRGLRERGVALFVNSATPLEPLERLLARRGLDRFFAGIYGAPATKLENLRAIRDGLRARPEELVCVGDGDDDREAAAALPCRFVAVAGSLHGLPGLLACAMEGGRVSRAGH